MPTRFWPRAENKICRRSELLLVAGVLATGGQRARSNAPGLAFQMRRALPAGGGAGAGKIRPVPAATSRSHCPS